MPQRHRATALLGISAASSVPPAALAVSGAPWWALLVATLPGAMALMLQSVFPQNSQDRLEWWRDRRRHREHLSRASPPATDPGDR
ncbi:hypothetical protein [Streptomyces sp. NBC_01465]|uniref:hypothetical protein n=1 Tax=Streptomyces sp. NBC_01465 TaxID=2903878 RepID=UPI002E31B92F|nr:hypothetical protein [Streptomyces sp. NBC_01465]